MEYKDTKNPNLHIVQYELTKFLIAVFNKGRYESNMMHSKFFEIWSVYREFYEKFISWIEKGDHEEPKNVILLGNSFMSFEKFYHMFFVAIVNLIIGLLKINRVQNQQNSEVNITTIKSYFTRVQNDHIEILQNKNFCVDFYIKKTLKITNFKILNFISQKKEVRMTILRRAKGNFYSTFNSGIQNFKKLYLDFDMSDASFVQTLSKNIGEIEQSDQFKRFVGKNNSMITQLCLSSGTSEMDTSIIKQVEKFVFNFSTYLIKEDISDHSQVNNFIDVARHLIEMLVLNRQVS
jgi:hypothetical protein